MKNADLALYRAKADGRAAYHFFEKGMDALLQERLAVEIGLRTALADEVDPAMAELARGVAGVSGATVAGRHLVVAAEDPGSVTPELVRALVRADASIVEVIERASTLEDVYFEIMGVRPGAGGEAA